VKGLQLSDNRIEMYKFYAYLGYVEGEPKTIFETQQRTTRELF
jgi:hypothetical protein